MATVAVSTGEAPQQMPPALQAQLSHTKPCQGLRCIGSDFATAMATDFQSILSPGTLTDSNLGLHLQRLNPARIYK